VIDRERLETIVREAGRIALARWPGNGHDLKAWEKSPGNPVCEADLLVSTIPVAAQREELVAAWRDVPALFDVVYDPWPTPLAVAAADAGRTLVSGLDLLVHQAALQVPLMTGRDAPLEAMRAAGERELAERSRT